MGVGAADRAADGREPVRCKGACILNKVIGDIKRAKEMFEALHGYEPSSLLLTLGMARKIAPQARWLTSFEQYPDNTVLKFSNGEVTIYEDS